MMQAAEELMQVARNAAIDAVRRPTPALWGYIADYDPDTNAVKVSLPMLTPAKTPNQPFVTGWMPLGTPCAGKNYGLQFYPEVGTPCVVLFLNRDEGDVCVGFCLYNDILPPSGLTRDPGSIELRSKGGGNGIGSIYISASGTIQMQQGTTPVAVEGSATAGHQHGMTAYTTALTAALAAATPSVALTFASPPDTDKATDTIAVGQGAQSVLAPAPGGK